jgi:hypothetical protein
VASKDPPGTVVTDNTTKGAILLTNSQTKDRIEMAKACLEAMKKDKSIEDMMRNGLK